MRLCILCVHIETSSLWAEFVNKNRCISVRLITSIPGGTKHLILIIHIIVSYDQNISKIIFVKMDPMSGCKHPSCVYFSAQRQYTAVQKIRTLLNNFPCVSTLVLWVYAEYIIVQNIGFLI